MKCRACGLAHSSLLRCEVAARIAASNTAPKCEFSASNAEPQVVHAEAVASNAPKKQRWDREKYNAYQRDLMRERRANPKGVS